MALSRYSHWVWHAQAIYTRSKHHSSAILLHIVSTCLTTWATHATSKHLRRWVGPSKPATIRSHVWILPIKIHHPPAVSLKARLRHGPHRASMNHWALRDISMVTKLLQVWLSHSLLLTSRGHLFDHHGRILPLLQ